VVVDAFHLRGTARGPEEAQAKLIVHPYRVLAGAIAYESLESVVGWGCQVLQGVRRIEHDELSLQDSS
jgi:hypothetical protein